MSAPDPKAWALTDADWERMVDIYGHWNSELPEAIQSVARRRAIEELNALAESAMQEPNQLQICPIFTVRLEDIRHRIAAIEAEEA